jgi:hypothetical protein
MLGNSVLVAVWLLVGVLGFVAGLVWLRAVERSRRASGHTELTLPRPTAGAAAPDAREPDALAG